MTVTAAEFDERDERYMREAISLAAKAEALDEVPVGAVVVHKGALIVGRGYNARETKKNALCHAEIMAIDEACRTLGGWRLPECELFVTLEPCPMCAGAEQRICVQALSVLLFPLTIFR